MCLMFILFFALSSHLALNWLGILSVDEDLEMVTRGKVRLCDGLLWKWLYLSLISNTEPFPPILDNTKVIKVTCCIHHLYHAPFRAYIVYVGCRQDCLCDLVVQLNILIYIWRTPSQIVIEYDVYTVTTWGKIRFLENFADEEDHKIQNKNKMHSISRMNIEINKY